MPGNIQSVWKLSSGEGSQKGSISMILTMTQIISSDHIQAWDWTFEKTWNCSTLRKSFGKAWCTYAWLGAFRSNWRIHSRLPRMHCQTERNDVLFFKALIIFSTASSVSPVHLHVHLPAERCLHVCRLNPQMDRLEISYIYNFTYNTLQ